ncbi:hypothetical protein D3H65_15325 [Paraflavitalea soli]|uniref:Uncharacterized protein n=1 Tax=Paraflavitalea soli TaxID=2315862 RepID=A0A3B7MLC0_9BACT|nr:hypothetical protein [Paraflavitalea soli]AXY75272.1 hypothetical protein D3H65_15325 [Paraflavitalea soli]
MKKTTPGAKTSSAKQERAQPARPQAMPSADLTDPPEEEAKLQGDEATLDLPEVKDIPGQEHIHVPRMREFGDVTASSDDEEGGSILDDPEDEDIQADRGSNVSQEEAALLAAAADYNSDEDDKIIRATALDSTDEEGDPLNEKGFRNAYSGTDLDVPGSEDDDADEAIGEEDEENNAYSVDEENEDDEK